MSGPLWTPSPERAAAAQLTHFRRQAERVAQKPLPDYRALHRWSVDEPELFWRLLWQQLGMISEAPPRAVFEGTGLRETRWFPDVRLSFAENLLRRRDQSPALVGWSERGARRELSWAQLYDSVARLAAGLRRLGVKRGDRVAALLPNAPEAAVAMLAVNSLGAVWSLCSLDFGVDALADRFAQIEPRFLIGEGPRAAELRARLPTVEKLLLFPGDLDQLMASPAPLSFERLPFAEPAFILFTSGTTGPPKCIVHGMGGFLLQLLKELRLHYDVRPGDRFFYYTSSGWNMWYWLMVGLAAEATVYLYDGSPFYPRPTLLFDHAEREQLQVFGASPAYFAELQRAGVQVTQPLASLRTILSTGAPLSAEQFRYIYAKIKSDVCLSSISGGTEINACFGTGDPAGAVWAGELQALGLGMRVEVWDEAGRPAAGKGELVCTAPFPSLPLGLWNDPGERFSATYLERYPGVWHHGDFAERTEHGGLIIHGRSDATLKPGGHRIGTAEIYRQVERIPAVEDSLAVGQEWQGDVRIVLFVKLRPGAALDAALKKQIRDQLRQNASPHHAPARIVEVQDIPRTRNGKKAELAVREIIHGRAVANRSALENPGALDEYGALLLS